MLMLSLSLLVSHSIPIQYDMLRLLFIREEVQSPGQSAYPLHEVGTCRYTEILISMHRYLGGTPVGKAGRCLPYL